MKIVELTPIQRRAAVQVLTQAFHDEPVSVYGYPDPDERDSVLEWFFDGFVRYGELFGKVFTTDAPVVGAAIWLKPGGHIMETQRMKRAGLLPTRQSQDTVARLRPIFARVDVLHDREVGGDHWYLPYLGVAPDHQGQGIGGQLLAPVISQATKDGISCYTWTATPRNVKFYMRQGFELISDEIEPKSGIHLWTFLRNSKDYGSTEDAVPRR